MTCVAKTASHCMHQPQILISNSKYYYRFPELPTNSFFGWPISRERDLPTRAAVTGEIHVSARLLLEPSPGVFCFFFLGGRGGWWWWGAVLIIQFVNVYLLFIGAPAMADSLPPTLASCIHFHLSLLNRERVPRMLFHGI